MKTLEEIEKIPKNILSPEDVCSYTGGDPHVLRMTARRDKKSHMDSLGFPVMLIGNRVKVPKEAFIRAMRGEKIVLKREAENV